MIELLTTQIVPMLAPHIAPIMFAGMVLLLVSTQLGWTHRLRDRTKLYFAVNAIGRWSMIDMSTWPSPCFERRSQSERQMPVPLTVPTENRVVPESCSQRINDRRRLPST